MNFENCWNSMWILTTSILRNSKTCRFTERAFKGACLYEISENFKKLKKLLIFEKIREKKIHLNKSNFEVVNIHRFQRNFSMLWDLLCRYAQCFKLFEKIY